MNPYQVTDLIAGSLNRTAESAQELLDSLDEPPGYPPTVVIVDALDEARDPRATD